MANLLPNAGSSSWLTIQKAVTPLVAATPNRAPLTKAPTPGPCAYSCDTRTLFTLPIPLLSCLRTTMVCAPGGGQGL